MEKEYDFIINPKARSGMGMKAWQKIESELKARHNIGYAEQYTGK